MNVIEFRLCDEDRARLDDIICGLAALLGGSGAMSDAAVAMAAQKNEPAPAPVLPVEGDAQFGLVDTPTPFDETPEPAPEAKPVSKAEFQKAIVLRCAESAATKAKVQDLVHKYAASVSAIPEEKRAEVLAELAKL